MNSQGTSSIQLCPLLSEANPSFLRFLLQASSSGNLNLFPLSITPAVVAASSSYWLYDSSMFSFCFISPLVINYYYFFSLDIPTVVYFSDWTLAGTILDNGNGHRKNILNVWAWFVFSPSLGHSVELC